MNNNIEETLLMADHDNGLVSMFFVYWLKTAIERIEPITTNDIPKELPLKFYKEG